jgi:hypothetical protein
MALSGQHKRHVRILAQGHELLLAIVPIFPAPELAASRGDEEKQAFAIGQPVGFFPGLGFANFCVSKQNTTPLDTTMQ